MRITHHRFFERRLLLLAILLMTLVSSFGHATPSRAGDGSTARSSANTALAKRILSQAATEQPPTLEEKRYFTHTLEVGYETAIAFIELELVLVRALEDPKQFKDKTWLAQTTNALDKIERYAEQLEAVTPVGRYLPANRTHRNHIRAIRQAVTQYREAGTAKQVFDGYGLQKRAELSFLMLVSQLRLLRQAPNEPNILKTLAAKSWPFSIDLLEPICMSAPNGDRVMVLVDRDGNGYAMSDAAKQTKGLLDIDSIRLNNPDKSGELAAMDKVIELVSAACPVERTSEPSGSPVRVMKPSRINIHIINGTRDSLKLGEKRAQAWEKLKTSYTGLTRSIIEDSDIETYDWSTHTFTLSLASSKRVLANLTIIPEAFEDKLLKQRAFVVTLDSKPLYGGVFMPRADTVKLDYPVMYVSRIKEQLVFEIRPAHPSPRAKPVWREIATPALRDVLREAGKLAN